MTWTPERTAALCDLWNAGRTTGQIAQALGVSRASVSGRIARLKAAGSARIKRLNDVEQRVDALAAKLTDAELLEIMALREPEIGRPMSFWAIGRHLKRRPADVEAIYRRIVSDLVASDAD